MRIKLGNYYINQRTEYSRFYLEDENGEKIKTKEAEEFIENYTNQNENPNNYFRIEDSRLHWMINKETEYIFVSPRIKTIEPYAFRDNNYLKFAFLGNNVETIFAFAFSGCTKLKEVILPRSISEIQQYAFSDCEEMEIIYYEGTKKEWERIKKDRYWKFGNSATIITLDGIIN